ncbi:unnamed protein product [Didymodactylos carnosus]|uniref:PARG catalytic Macro domain-containing protein n=1 Tax=Didymodactylos carnosus TaxID=1234261 RepID=A0A813X9Y2_9BILA|nr:unnamed protein product [Didymodactylos carnosus]CAF0867496.1 unnamed protein product [Didymodactylos carnosus]CAF3570993.1 unnamed protein product [Didymodactylos carnosus]CAF3654958.1 unnamed protein product [Didymodactylos carnosus]
MSILILPTGVLTFHRFCLSSSNTNIWKQSTERLSDLQLPEHGKIEDMVNCLQVDFANKYIGGGILQSGAVQEEIRFATCPEIDVMERRVCEVVAMDALPFQQSDLQYNLVNIERELMKSYVAFVSSGKTSAPPKRVATGHWGCGVFNGNKELKALIQLAAASHCQRPVVYITMGDIAFRAKFMRTYNLLVQNSVCVKDLYNAMVSYGKQKERNKLSLFDWILSSNTSNSTVIHERSSTLKHQRELRPALLDVTNQEENTYQNKNQQQQQKEKEQKSYQERVGHHQDCEEFFVTITEDMDKAFEQIWNIKPFEAIFGGSLLQKTSCLTNSSHMKDKTWYLFNDETVRPYSDFNKDDIMAKECFGGGESLAGAYMLYYKRYTSTPSPEAATGNNEENHSFATAMNPLQTPTANTLPSHKALIELHLNPLIHNRQLSTQPIFSIGPICPVISSMTPSLLNTNKIIQNTKTQRAILPKKPFIAPIVPRVTESSIRFGDFSDDTVDEILPVSLSDKRDISIYNNDEVSCDQEFSLIELNDDEQSCDNNQRHTKHVRRLNESFSK